MECGGLGSRLNCVVVSMGVVNLSGFRHKNLNLYTVDIVAIDFLLLVDRLRQAQTYTGRGFEGRVSKIRYRV